MKKNDMFDAPISGYTSEGFGVARIEGRAVFVRGAINGETCRVRIVKTGSNAVYGRLEQVLVPSPHRLSPECPDFGRCGGCAFWHMDYEEELRAKAARVRDALNRIGGCALDEISIQGSPAIEGYRNKAIYPVAAVSGHPTAGFFRARSHDLIPIDRCRIQNPAADRVRGAVVDWMRGNDVPAYDEKTRRGLVRGIFIRTATTGQILCCIVANGGSLPRVQRLLDGLQDAEPGLAALVLNEHREPGNAVLGGRFETLWGPGYIEETLCGLQFRLSTQSFFQVNHDQAERLYEAALDRAGLTGCETALDLYCGTGTITLCLARRALHAIGVETVETAVADAKENARRNGIENAEFFCADAGEAAAELARRGTRPDVIVVDPPRKGLSPEVIEAVAQMAPARLVYVSCDPATLARDVALLRPCGYELQSAECFDMFPRCAHTESCCLLTKKS